MQGEAGFWQNNWRADVLSRALESARRLGFVYVASGGIVGFVCGHDLGFRGYLSELIVAKIWKGKGTGKRLVVHLESALAARGCGVLIADVRKNASGFYQSMDWTSPDVVLLRKRIEDRDSQASPARDVATRAARED